MNTNYPVALSEEELAKIKERADADRLTTWPTYVLRLLATIKSRDRVIEELASMLSQLNRRSYPDAYLSKEIKRLKLALKAANARADHLHQTLYYASPRESLF